MSQRNGFGHYVLVVRKQLRPRLVRRGGEPVAR